MLPAASMTSVATVRENRLLGETGMAPPLTHQAGRQEEQATQSLPAMDVDALYDDVMQCVYDDVASTGGDLDIFAAAAASDPTAGANTKCNTFKRMSTGCPSFRGHS